ncbi:MAG: (deoxy)nucleoside triphosphate pyrophosphohydrolase [Thermoguttaceae bacterium]|nr:(deoxy)nucleoside triphosphate pyrophosphohydrolase [Thermoguttaceae bacterium]
MSAVSVAVAVVQYADQVLVGRRPEGSPLAGFWEFPGGKVQPHETPEQAAVRECREETGLEVRLVGPVQEVLYEYPHGPVCLYFHCATPLDPTRSPTAPFRWVPVGELAEYRFPPANAPIVEQLLRRCWTAENTWR